VKLAESRTSGLKRARAFGAFGQMKKNLFQPDFSAFWDSTFRGTTIVIQNKAKIRYYESDFHFHQKTRPQSGRLYLTKNTFSRPTMDQ
jgi:hypothetical protein